MEAPRPRIPSGSLSEQEISYLKLLKTLRTAGQHGASDLGVVGRIAAWITAEPVIRYICLHQRWYDDWEVKEALLRNDATPQEFRPSLEGQISIFDLLRELDSPHLTAEERGEIREDVRSLFKTLPERDRRVVKERAYSLSSSRQEAEGGAAVAEAPVAQPTEGTEEGASSALETSEIVLGLHGPIVEPEPSAEAKKAEEDFDAWLAAEQAQVEEELKTAEAARAAEVTLEAPPELPASPEPAPTVGVELPEAAEDISHLQLPDDFGDEEQAFDEVALQGKSLEDLTQRPIDQLSLEEKMWVASAAETRGVLEVLSYSTNEEVQLALLDNPILPDELASALSRRASARVANAIYRNRRLFQRPRIRDSLLECPNAPSAAQLEAVNSLSEFSALLKVVGSPKVRHLEVKAKARSRLGERFRSLAEGEKMAAVRKGGRLLLKELWRDFFRDEELVLRCLREKQLDEGSVLEIARSKIAPRRALEQIGKMPGWTGNYQITLALVLNPKTPRMITARLLRKLSPSDRRMVKNNPSLPEFVRDLA